MEVRNAGREQIIEAFEEVKRQYGGNVEMRGRHYGGATNEPERLDGKRERYSVRLKPVSARRPGARVSQQRFTSFGTFPEKPRRIGASCWHVHRDFLQALFDIAPDARVISALADYRSREDFEEKFPATYHGAGMSGPAPIQDIGGACNCDEGEYPEFAVEGLTQEQYDWRELGWDEGWSGVKKPKRERAIIQEVIA